MGDQHAIEALGLTKSYGGVTVLSGVDVAVAGGTVFALLGPNGAGKTTTVRILATLTRPDGGRARVAGHDVVTARSRVRRAISLTGQDTALDELQTGAENLVMMGRLRGLGRAHARRRAGELLERFDLADASTRRVATYSGGMRRRLDLAAGLLGDPEVIFLDEPTTGLDPRSRKAMWEVVEELTRTGVTILLTTQYLDEADHLAHRVAVLDGGRIVAEGTSAALKQQVGGHRLELALTDADAFAHVRDAVRDRMLHSDPATRRIDVSIDVSSDGSAVGVRTLLDELDPTRGRIASFALHSATLDDVFLSLTGHAATDHAATDPAPETADV